MKSITRRDSLTAIFSTGLTPLAAKFRILGPAMLGPTALGSTSADLKGAIFANKAPFNASGNGKADDSAALRAAFELAIASGRTLVLQGTYRVTGPLVDGKIRTHGTFNLHLADAVVIEVDKSAKRFDTLIHLMTEMAITSVLSGTRLTLRLNGRSASGLIVRYLSPSPTGRLTWSAQVRVYDAFNDIGNETTDNYGIAVVGQYKEVTINRPVVERTGRARRAGESKSLSVVGYTGRVTISQPYLATVTAPPGEADVDLLALFPAAQPGNPWARRSGTAVVSNGNFIDAQGRSIKLQGRASLSGNKYIRTGKIISMRESCEVDAQFDDVIERGATYRYTRAKDGRSPLGEHHVLLSVQHLVGDVELNSVMSNATVYSEVPIWGGISINQSLQTRTNSFGISDITIHRLGGFAGDVFERAIVEFDGDKIANTRGTLILSVKSAIGPIGVPIIGYSVSSVSFFSKIKAKISDCRNSGKKVPIVDSIGGRLELPVFEAKLINNIGWKIAGHAN